jgi:hypothetical protein
MFHRSDKSRTGELLVPDDSDTLSLTSGVGSCGAIRDARSRRPERDRRSVGVMTT